MDDTQRANIAARVKAERMRRGWSQVELADRAGVSENTVVTIENNSRRTQTSKLRKVLTALDMPPALDHLDLDGVPEDVRTFLTAVTPRLASLPEPSRSRLMADFYPALLAADHNRPDGASSERSDET